MANNQVARWDHFDVYDVEMANNQVARRDQFAATAQNDPQDYQIARYYQTLAGTRNYPRDFLSAAMEPGTLSAVMEPGSTLSVTGVEYSPGSIKVGSITYKPNPAREKCYLCKQSFTDRPMLERHYRDVTRHCTRCNNKEHLTCKYGLDAWLNSPACRYGCEQCEMCFDRESQMKRHNRKFHRYSSYYGGCLGEEYVVYECF